MGAQRALISVSDKTWLVDLGRGLHDLGVELVASGGSAATLRAAGVPVREVRELTGFPEILGGRVKTLHPGIHGGILARRTPDHLAELDQHQLVPFDIVVCNLYPFSRTVAQPGTTLAEAVEQIDIGGVTLLRAAAKNHESVVVVSDPSDYADVLEALPVGKLDESYRRRLALKAFQLTAAYDTTIATYLAAMAENGETRATDLPATLELAYQRVQILRYGENPQQQAALYRPVMAGAAVLQPQPVDAVAFEQLGGKEMSYNNWLDLDAAWSLAQEFVQPTVCIIKHTNPCGVASGPSLAEAYPRAFESDPVSAFGSIVAFNVPADGEVAAAMADLFVEVVVAPGYTPEALERFRRKANLRILRPAGADGSSLTLRSTQAGLLVQTADDSHEPTFSWRIVTQRQPTADELDGLEFAWRVARHVKSNAIVFASRNAAGVSTVGVGAGQMSRVDSVHLAARRAGDRAQGAVMASDAFFPFADGIEAAAAAGITAVVQPGGSVRDEEVIAACDRLGLSMCFTGVRHFRH